MNSRPNVVFILTDDQGYGEIGAHGNPVIQTPHLDALHADSVRFTDYHVGTTCAPTRAGLLTGHDCNSTGVWHTIGGRSLLREDEWTLATAFKEAGYATGHFGKWHLGDAQPFRPHERGFDLSIYHGGGGIGNAPDAWGNDYFDDKYFVNGELTQFKGFCTEVFFTEALRFIEDHRDEPFFCYLAPNTPHNPWNIEPCYSDPYLDHTPTESRARFYGTVTNLDEHVGRLRSRLAELGLAEKTILIFMTDNGSGGGVDCDKDGFVQEGPGNFNAGMRGEKCSPYEGGHRVPFFLHWPDGDAVGGRDVNQLTAYTDVMPTLLDCCGVPVPEGRSFDGQSLRPLLQGEADPQWDERVAVTDTQRVARPVKWRKSCVMQGRYRLIHGRELYDLATDPGQRSDVAGDHPEVVSRLRDAYEVWWQRVSRQFDRDIPFALGRDKEPVHLTTHDIRNEAGDTAWHQRQVRLGEAVSGYWAVDVATAGSYSIELRRWPRDTDHALEDGIEGDDVPWRRDCVEEHEHYYYTGGQPLALRWAQLEVAGETCHQEIEGGAKAVVFNVALPAGPTRLYAAFYDEQERTLAPYYITVSRQENAEGAHDTCDDGGVWA
ncbi:MAG: arylsulfatase [Planctomycetota bacterium]|jgi:arylsulfatase A-like enzyme